MLRPGGRFAVSDVIADEDMDEATRADMAQWTGCIAGALTRERVRAGARRRRPGRHRDHRDPPRPRAAPARRSSAPASRRAQRDRGPPVRPAGALPPLGGQASGARSRSTSPPTPSSGGTLSGEDRGLIFWVLSSLMVAEERITTKFSGLVGAHGSEEEATFLATQQVDEARHMQFYARFQDEVVADPAAIAAHVERAREQISPAFRQIFDVALVEAHERLVANPGRRRGEGPLRHPLPPDPRGHARADLVQLRHRLPGARGAAAGLRRRLLEDPPRRAAPHRLRHLVPARSGGREPALAEARALDAARAAAGRSPSR